MPLCRLDTGTIGAITTMPSFEQTMGHATPSLHGVIVSAILIPAAVSSFLAGSWAEKIDRRRTMQLSAAIFTIGAALESGSVRIAMLIVARVITGLGEGTFFAIACVYITEIAPASQRGALVSMIQFLTTHGICFGFFLCYGTIDISDSLSGRFSWLLQSGVAFTYALLCFCVPESPCWLIAERQLTCAAASRRKLGQDKELEEEDDMNEDIIVSSDPHFQHHALKTWNQKLVGWTFIFERSVLKRTLLSAFIRGMH